MLNILLVIFPFFALVLCGYVAARRALLPQAAIPGLNSFVLYFALPCMLYRFGASTPIAQLLDGSLVAVYLLCALLMVGFTVAVTLHRDNGPQHGVGWNDASFGALVAAFPNTGFMGVVANPMPWSIALGALASAVGFVLPKPIMGAVSLLADAASPVALFTIGAVLARSQMNSTTRTPLADYVPVALIKLVIHPLLVGGGLSFPRAWTVKAQRRWALCMTIFPCQLIEVGIDPCSRSSFRL